MKKSARNILTGTICVVAAAAVIGGGAVIGSATRAEKKSIGSDSAVSAAFEDAGIKKEDVLRTKSSFERENGKYVYEVEFDADGKEYDYIIDAESGSVITRDVENDTKPTKAVPVTEAEQQTKKAFINVDTAKANALKDAGLSADKVKFIKAKLDADDETAVYDIEFIAENKEYDYEINALTGKVYEKDVEIKQAPDKAPVTTTQAVTRATTTAKATEDKNVGLEKAKQIALSNAGVNASEVTFVKAALDRDDGISVYDIEFFTASKEYEYEINAATGGIRDKDIEIIERRVQTTKTTAQAQKSDYIGVDSAKQIALEHAGLNASDVRFTKVKLDRDDGIAAYEIEFVSGRYEFEYEINAKSGRIVDFDKEYDD